MTDEFGRIDIIRQLINLHPAISRQGLDATVGVDACDDCAVIPMGGDRDLIVTSDFIRGELFALYKAGLLNPRDIGAYLVAANVSDLAAMGAEPFGLTAVYRYTSDTTDKHFREIISGITESCRQFSIPLVGGDTGSYETPVLSATALGTCPTGRALLRSGGQAGDRLFITGDVGLAGAAYRYFAYNRTSKIASLPKSDEDELIGTWRCITPAVEQGHALVQAGLARCGIDTSDGLGTSCSFISRLSNVDVILEEDKIPMPRLLVQVAECLNVQPLYLALGVSVDFRLLFTTSPTHVDEVVNLFSKNKWGLYDIGYLRTPQESASVYLDDGVECHLLDSIECFH